MLPGRTARFIRAETSRIRIGACAAVFAAFGAPVFIPELLTKNTLVAAIPAPPPSVIVLYEFVNEFEHAGVVRNVAGNMPHLI